MNVLAIVQARMGSTRLPGKVLRLINGKPLLILLLERLKHSKVINRIVVATSISKEDRSIINIAKSHGFATFAGSENDVLDRAYQAAKQEGGRTLVRITGDSPLIDPFKVDGLIEFFLENRKRYDYVAFGKSFPEGQNAEVFSFKLLEAACKEAKAPSEREHFTAFIWGQPQRFRCFRMESERDHSRYRWTVDEPEDLTLVRRITKSLYQTGKCFTMEEIILLLEKNPRLQKLNSGIKRDEGYLLSLAREGKGSLSHRESVV